MGFFDGFIEGYKEYEKEKARAEQEKKGIKSVKPKKYQPGHKDKVGPAKKNALINLLCTDDLDEVFECCAPHLTETIYEIRDKQANTADYYKLQGRYNELQKHYDELLKQYNNLNQTLQNITKQTNLNK